MFKEERTKSYGRIALCVAGFILGWILLEWLSTRENPLLGNTFYIITGNLLMACAVIGIGLQVRKLYRLRKKQRRKKSGSPVVFLDKPERRRRSSKQGS